MKISVCIPCYKSSKTLPFVVDEIKSEFAKREGYEYEIVLVNDGSPDDNKTFETIKSLCAEDKKIIGVNLSRNHGQASAKLAAVRYATGDALVYMDDDGQHPAYGIFELIRKIEEGYDVVYARFTNKKLSVFKKITSKIHKCIAEALGAKPKGVEASPFIAWSRLSMESIKNYHSPFPSPGAYLACITSRFVNVDMEHRPRKEGKSNYNLKKLVMLWLNGFTNFSIVPLRAASFIGFGCSALGFVAGVYTVIRKLLNPSMVAGYASTIAVLLFIGGVIMIMLGLIGEYIGRMYMILSDKPQVTVHQTINYRDEEE